MISTRVQITGVTQIHSNGFSIQNSKQYKRDHHEFKTLYHVPFIDYAGNSTRLKDKRNLITPSITHITHTTHTEALDDTLGQG
jgi:hypothetical protein